MRSLLTKAFHYSLDYLESLDTRPVAPSPQAVEALQDLRVPLPDVCCDPGETIDLLDRYITPATMGMPGGRFFGFVIGGALPVTVAARWLATAWDQNAFAYSISPGVAELERIALGWLVEILGLPAGSGAAFVTGASAANFTALAAARQAVLYRLGWDVAADGLFGAPPIRVVVGAEAHPTLLKAITLLGLGRSRLEIVPVDGQGRMLHDALPSLDERTIVCTQAGNVNTGAFDPLREICERARQAGAWVHVDGAFGLWAAASPALACLVDGVGLADSWSTDAHKWLNVPYDCGLAFVRDPQDLRQAMAVSAAYLPEQGARNPSDYTPELSRRARGVEVWAALRTLGRQGLTELVERCCRHARRFAEGLTQAGYPILNDVVLNQVLVSFGEAETTRRVIAAIQSDGVCWCGGTVWQGQTAMRISVSSWATTDEDVERSLGSMLDCAQQSA